MHVRGDPNYFYDVRMMVAELAHDFDLASEGFKFLGRRLWRGLSLVSPEDRVSAVHNLEHHLEQRSSESASIARSSLLLCNYLALIGLDAGLPHFSKGPGADTLSDLKLVAPNLRQS